MSVKHNNFFKRWVVYFIIFNHLATAQLLAEKYPTDKIFPDGEFVDHFTVSPRFSSNHKIFLKASPDEVKVLKLPLHKLTSGSYGLSVDSDMFDNTMNVFLVDETQDNEIIGHIISNKKMVSFIGAKGCDFEVESPWELRSLDVSMGGNLHFLKDVKINEHASLRSNSLSFGGVFNASGFLELDVQENIINQGFLKSGKNIVAKFKELKNHSTIKSLGDIIFKGKQLLTSNNKTNIKSNQSIYFDIEKDINNNGFITSEKLLSLSSNKLINRDKISSSDIIFKIKDYFNNIGTIFASGNSEAHYKRFENSGFTKIQGDFSSQGDVFNGQRSTHFPDNLWIGGIYQAKVKDYIDSGANYWDSFATIQAENLKLFGKYTCTSAMLNSENDFTVGDRASFQTSHFIGLKAEGTVDFRGKVLLTPDAKKCTVSQGPAFDKFSKLIKKIPHTLSIEGKKGVRIWDNGSIASETTSITYSTEGNFQSKGKISSGFFSSNTIEIKALNADLSGSLISYGDIVARIQENLDIMGELTAHRFNAISQNIQISGSLSIEDTLNLNADGYINHEGKTHAKNILAQGTSITNTGDITATDSAHFKADKYFANLWGGNISARDMNIDASLNLNFLSTLHASRSLTINTLVDLNLFGLESAHHLSSSSFLTLNAGLCLPSPILEDIFSWEMLKAGTQATAMAFLPPQVRTLINLGFAAHKIYNQVPFLYNRFQNLGETYRFSDCIPLFVGLKDLAVSGSSAYSLYSDLKFDISMPVFSIKNTVTAALNPFLPSITQDSLFNFNMGVMGSGNIYQRGVYSNNLGYVSANNYTNDTWFARNAGNILGNNISFSNTDFLNTGKISAYSNANIEAEKITTEVGSHLTGNKVFMKGEDVQHNGVARAVGEDNYLLINGSNTTTIGKRSVSDAALVDIGQEEGGIRSKRVCIEEGAQVKGANAFIRGEDIQHNGNVRVDNYLFIKGDNITTIGKRSVSDAALVDIGHEEAGSRSKRVSIEDGAQIGRFKRGEDGQQGIAHNDNYLLINEDSPTTLEKRPITDVIGTGYEEGAPPTKRVCNVRVGGDTIELGEINSRHRNTPDMAMPILSELYVEGAIVNQLGTTNSEDRTYIKATEQYMDTEESRNESGGTIELIAPKNNGFNGRQVAGEKLSLELNDMDVESLLNQTSAPTTQACLHNGNIVLEKDLNVSTSLQLQVQRFENNANVSANKDFVLYTTIETINRGKMVAEGDMDVESQGLIDNHGHMAGATLNVKAPIVINECEVERISTSDGYVDQIKSQATMRANNGDLNVEGTKVLHGQGGHFEAPNGTPNVKSGPEGMQHLGSQPLEQDSAYWQTDGKTLTYFHHYQQTQHLTQIIGGGDINLWSGTGGTTLNGVAFHSKDGNINHGSAGELREHEVHNISQTDTTWKNMYKDKHGEDHTYTATVIQNHIKPGPGKKVHMDATENIFLQSPFIDGAKFVSFQSQNGKVNINPAMSTSWASSEVSSKNLVWWYNKQKGQYDEMVVMPNIQGTTPENIHISGAQGVQVGIKNAGNNQTQYLDMLEQIPGTEWIKGLRNNPNLTWNLINEEHEKWNHKAQGLTGPTAAVIGITLSIVTMGTGAALLALPAASLQGVMASAAFSSLASQASISLINNTGNIGAVFKEMTSKDSVRSLATSVVSAGITHGLSNQFNFSQPTNNFTDRLTHHFRESLVSSATSAGLAILIQQQDVKEALLQAAKNIVVDTVGGTMANEISDAYAEKNLNWVTHKFAHGALGAFTGAILGDDPAAGALAGALGGMASEIIADAMLQGAAERAYDTARAQAAHEGRPINPNELQAAFSVEAQKVKNFGRVGTALSAFVLGQDVNIANRTGTNALENNFIPLVMVGLSVASALYSGYEVHKAYDEAYSACKEAGAEEADAREAGAKAALKALGIEVAINAVGGGIGKLGGKAASAAFKTVLDKNPILAIGFNKASQQLDNITDVATNSKVGQAVSKLGTAGEKFVGKVNEQLGGTPKIVKPQAVDTSEAAYYLRVDWEEKGPMAIDSRLFTGRDRTLNGGIRNRTQFWELWNEKYPGMMSGENLKRIQNGHSPRVDPQWISNFPEHHNYIGQTLEHHHIDHGALAVPLPRDLHRGEGNKKIWHDK